MFDFKKVFEIRTKHLLVDLVIICRRVCSEDEL